MSKLHSFAIALINKLLSIYILNNEGNDQPTCRKCGRILSNFREYIMHICKIEHTGQPMDKMKCIFKKLNDEIVLKQFSKLQIN